MNMYDILSHKREGLALTAEEIDFFIQGYTRGEIPDYQASALLMAICLRGMDAAETAALTLSMARSGDMVDLSRIPGIKVDKHSTGGVGDKTTLIVLPIVAACGVHMAKMSGRGLGHTGGTIDKLESIPGFITTLTEERFFDTVNRVGACIAGQSLNLAPADKKLYALRDVTATVSSLPLIASSIMSKKLAGGADCILLDVKTGSGAFMKSVDEARALAQEMISIGKRNGRRVRAMITNMDLPLGHAVGNSLEVKEAVDVLSDKGPADLRTVSLELAAELLSMATDGPREQAMARAISALTSGQALHKLCELVTAQGGDARFITQPERFLPAAVRKEVLSTTDGYLSHMDTEQIGRCAVALGAGRRTKEDTIDYAAGIMLEVKTGDRVRAGQRLAVLYSETQEQATEGQELYLRALTFSDRAPEVQPLIYERM